MTRLADMVRARDGRVVAIRCAACGLLFANLRGGTSRFDTPAQAHADHTWTHVASPGDVAAPHRKDHIMNLIQHLHRQRVFSERTFGPGARLNGVLDHIRKELVEVEAAGGADLEEWVDVVILALDGAWRSGASPERIVATIEAKQAKNEARTWPDWRMAEPGKAIEHVRDESESAA